MARRSLPKRTYLIGGLGIGVAGTPRSAGLEGFRDRDGGGGGGRFGGLGEDRLNLCLVSRVGGKDVDVHVFDGEVRTVAGRGRVDADLVDG